MLQKGEPKFLTALSLAAVVLVLAGLAVAVVHFHMPVKETYWALTPPVIAIALALITKEVYSSLFLGILTGAFLNAGFDLVGTLNQVFTGGLIKVLADKWNVGILIFLIILGMMVQLMNRAGGSAAFGRWASRHIKTRMGAQLATVVLGCLIFIDDYFNCLTVGSVMRPVTDKHMVSRAKLAYLIDSTAAPICIIAPISSWAAAVSGFVKGENGINLFVQAIPFNFYALLTIIMMILLITLNIDYGPMLPFERKAIEEGDLHNKGSRTKLDEEEEHHNTRGGVIDMLLPIGSLIVCCVVGMIYTGGYFSGTSFVESFANSDASVGLVLGSSVALLVTVVFYLVRQVLPFASCMECLPEGFKQMVPAMLILSFAWSLKAMTDDLGAAKFVAGVVAHSAGNFMNFLPCIIFLIAIGLAFATGTSWGTFGILIPIVVSCFQGTDHTMMVISISACMAGAVCGDHCSPISDTTIMSSAGAQCLHMDHVTTQLPYALTVAGVSFFTFLIAGFSKNALTSLCFGIALLALVLMAMRRRSLLAGR
ncbi:MAG: Na-H-antiporter domain-containing protein [Succiniclasticum sp.]|jgi:tetracycline resistance efflux pump